MLPPFLRQRRKSALPESPQEIFARRRESPGESVQGLPFQGMEGGVQPPPRCGVRGVQRWGGGSRNTPPCLWPSGATARCCLQTGIRLTPALSASKKFQMLLTKRYVLFCVPKENQKSTRFSEARGHGERGCSPLSKPQSGRRHTGFSGDSRLRAKISYENPGSADSRRCRGL